MIGRLYWRGDGEYVCDHICTIEKAGCRLRIDTFSKVSEVAVVYSIGQPSLEDDFAGAVHIKCFCRCR